MLGARLWSRAWRVLALSHGIQIQHNNASTSESCDKSQKRVERPPSAPGRLCSEPLPVPCFPHLSAASVRSRTRLTTMTYHDMDFDYDDEGGVIDPIWLLTICIALGIWLVVQRYRSLLNRAVFFRIPPPPVRALRYLDV